jgi:hypothetical protein
VGPEALARRRALVELRAIHTDAPQVVADLLRKVLDADRDAALGEDVVLGLRVGLAPVLPALQRLRHVGPHVPVARIVGLVLLEVDASVLQVDVAPAKARHLLRAHALACEKAVGQPTKERHIRKRAGLPRLHRLPAEQLGILARVEAFLGLLGR